MYTSIVLCSESGKSSSLLNIIVAVGFESLSTQGKSVVQNLTQKTKIMV